MNKYLLHIVLFFCFSHQFYAQEGGVVAFDLPVRNSLRFNRYAINPTFSFVREQNKYISFTNKKQWVQFDDAPQTYLFSYSGRFKENIGAGISVFQQDYGVLTTFGGVLNFAYNAVINRESNLTFGMNLGVYKSGLNTGKVITNFDDSSLNNIPSNMVFTINPGINYGTGFMDFGVSINNLVSYNLQTSKIIEDNPEQSIQGHIMYTGYLNSRGFFDESKFSGLVRSEFKKEKTVISGIMMLTVPKGIWAQVGYNTLYGASAGVGLNITNQIALEYNYEKAMGDLSNFGNSHEITLAYKFKNTTRFDYSGDDDEQAVFNPSKKPKHSKSVTAEKVDRAALAEAKENARIEAAEKLKAKQEAKVAARAKVVAEAKAKREAKNQAIADKEPIAQNTEEVQEEIEDEVNIEDTQAKLKEEEQRLAAEAKAKEDEAARVKAEELEKQKLTEEQERLRIEEENRLKLLAEAKAKEEARLKAEELEKQKLAEEQERLRIEEENRLKLLAEAKAKEEERVEQLVDTLDIGDATINVASDRESLAIKELIVLTENSKIEQQDLLSRLKETIASKQKDLDALKEENDLSEQGIVSTKPKVFKSVSAENRALEALTEDLDNLIDSQEDKISKLEVLYSDRLKVVKDKRDETNMFYQEKIQDLKSDQSKAIETKASLLSTLEAVKVATEIERKRRIKRADYDNEEDRYNKDRASLNQIKNNTALSTTPLSESDFDFGEELSSNIKIVNNVTNEESGYYLVIAVHSNASKRDEFLRKAVAAGERNVNFFYDVNTSKYYIYYKKFDYIDAAKQAMESKGEKPYNSKMSMVKIEN